MAPLRRCAAGTVHGFVGPASRCFVHTSSDRDSTPYRRDGLTAPNAGPCSAEAESSPASGDCSMADRLEAATVDVNEVHRPVGAIVAAATIPGRRLTSSSNHQRG